MSVQLEIINLQLHYFDKSQWCHTSYWNNQLSKIPPDNAESSDPKATIACSFYITVEYDDVMWYDDTVMHFFICWHCLLVLQTSVNAILTSCYKKTYYIVMVHWSETERFLTETWDIVQSWDKILFWSPKYFLRQNFFDLGKIFIGTHCITKHSSSHT